ncbi:hypothetical protein NPIL_538031 [Nephila pilipes]|uniref:Uncharacterized protein n=1 Tax=Nephila pilipes TaxID=299642 RepID=A0A8X6MWH9_NEPPI|nr:hypothetical protein NPIL_538031 [Nephila pilipes]
MLFFLCGYLSNNIFISKEKTSLRSRKSWQKAYLTKYYYLKPSSDRIVEKMLLARHFLIKIFVSMTTDASQRPATKITYCRCYVPQKKESAIKTKVIRSEVEKSGNVERCVPTFNKRTT